jgi:VWFA-related protein
MRFSLSLLLACALTCVALHAQDAPSVDAPPPESTAPVVHLDPNATTLNVNVNLVDIYFSARDHNGFVTSLRKQDCAVFEEGKQQTIKNFTQEKNLPLTIGILLDTSGSQQNVLPLEQDSGTRFLSQVLTPKDEAFLISFDVNVNLLTDYTDNAREIKRAMDQATINTASSSAGVPGIGGGPFPTSNPRGTLLFDAVYLAANDKLRPETGRKILVLLTDGGDQGSQVKLKDAIEAAQKANAIVYVILIADRAYHMGDVFDTSVSDMNQLAQQTGGRVINVGHSGQRLEQAFDQIQDELRTQYLLSYTPQNKTADGKFRKINIDCGKGLDIQARKGYYAIAGDTANE